MTPTTREQMLDVAVRLLDEGGVGAVTLREVGHGAGVSHMAPYKHFAGKEDLLAAVAARELTRLAARLTATRRQAPDAALRNAMRHYVAWALERPARFKLVFGGWSADLQGLGTAAEAAHARLLELVSRAQEAGALPPGDPERLGALIRALAHGAADLASAGHLQPDGKGHASADDLVDDLLAYLRAAATQPAGVPPASAASLPS